MVGVAAANCFTMSSKTSSLESVTSVMRFPASIRRRCEPVLAAVARTGGDIMVDRSRADGAALAPQRRGRGNNGGKGEAGNGVASVSPGGQLG